ncbi:response regulator [Pseudanabaena biceps]|nr:response regulator [Pseudanabaena biceps]
MNRASILIIDDEADNFDVIETLLNDQEYELHYASNGVDAIANLDNFQPDLILLDVMMPVMDGIEVCQRIKAIPEWNFVPIVMVTALSAKEDLAKCLEAGANDFISKPINSTEFRARVRSLLRLQEQHHKLERAYALIHAQLEASLEGVIAADEQGKLVAYNQKMCEIWGIDPITINPSNEDLPLLPLLEEANFPQVITQVLEDTYDSPEQITFGEIVNQDLTYEYFSSSVNSPSGKFLGFVWRFRDITDRKQYEATLQKSKEVAEAALRVKSDFLAMMSHEIRTPINGVLGMTELLSTTTLDLDQSRFVQSIQTSGEILLKVINDILDFSKLESQKLLLESLPVDVYGMLADTCNLLSKQAEAKGISLNYQIDDQTPPYILGDPIRLRQILLNLTNNSVKFTHSGEVSLSVSPQTSSPDNQDLLLRFTVKDSGIGLSAAQIQKLFQPFTQASISTARKYGGTGLGLVICQKLVQMMGGRIWAESIPDQGSTFFFEIPITVTDQAPSRVNPEIQRDISRQTNSPTNLSQKLPLRILIAEDNAINQELVLAMFAKIGYAPMIVNDGIEVIDALKANDFDLVFLDVQMPRMNGLEAAGIIVGDWANISTNPLRPKLIAMTASAMQGDREMCLDSGMDDYISKPVSFDTLQRILERWGNQPTPIATPTDKVTDNSEFNEQALVEIASISANLPKRMISLFLNEECPSLIPKLRQAIADGDASQVEYLAHTLKGSSRMLGAKAMAEVCLELEVAGRKQQLQDSDLLSDQLERLLPSVIEYLEAYTSV